MRMLYARMQYTVTSPGKNRLLTDTCCPWWGSWQATLYLSVFFTFSATDCVPPMTDYDIKVDNLVINSLVPRR